MFPGLIPYPADPENEENIRMKKDSIASICYPLNMEQMQKVKLSLSAKVKNQNGA